MPRFAQLGVVICLLFLNAGCDRRQEVRTDLLGGQAEREEAARRVRLLTEYRPVAEALAYPAGDPVPPLMTRIAKEKEGSAKIAALRNLAAKWRTTETGSPEVRAIRAQTASAADDAADALAGLENVPKGVVAIADDTVAGLLEGELRPYHRMKEIEGGVRDVVVAFVRMVQTQRSLPAAAEAFCAAETANDGRIGIDFDAGGVFADGPDVLTLRNSGPTLEDCTVAVEIKGVGDAVENVYFFRRWESGAALPLECATGDTLLGTDLPGTTAADVRALKVRVLSPTFSTRFGYEYGDAEKRRDYAAALQEATVTVRHRPFEAGYLYDTSREFYVGLGGVDRIPPCVIQLTDAAEAQTAGDFPAAPSYPLSLRFDHMWEGGGWVTIPVPDGQPEAVAGRVRVQLRFEDVDHLHEQVATVADVDG